MIGYFNVDYEGDDDGEIFEILESSFRAKAVELLENVFFGVLPISSFLRSDEIVRSLIAAIGSSFDFRSL
jgi:hypothetical protein